MSSDNQEGTQDGGGAEWFHRDRGGKVPAQDPNKIEATVTSGIWTQCPGCSEFLRTEELEAGLMVCSNCGQHHQISAMGRLEAIVDEAIARIVVDPRINTAPTTENTRVTGGIQNAAGDSEKKPRGLGWKYPSKNCTRFRDGLEKDPQGKFTKFVCNEKECEFGHLFRGEGSCSNPVYLELGCCPDYNCKSKHQSRNEVRKRLGVSVADMRKCGKPWWAGSLG